MGSRAASSRRVGAITIACALVLLGFVGADRFAGSLRADLVAAQEAMKRGKGALLEGEPGAAAAAFEDAGALLGAAEAKVSAPGLRAASVVPVLGRTPRALEAVVDGAAAAAAAGRVVAEALDELPGGVGAFVPREGKIPLRPVKAVTPSLRRAEDLVQGGLEKVEDAPGSLVLAPLSEVRDDLQRDLADAHASLDRAEALGRALPTLLGDDGPRRYFLGAQNPAELRGTGGFIGAYAVASAHRGRVRIGAFRPIETLRDVDPGVIRAPSRSYAHRYDRFGGAGFWRNLNMTPDFPTAAESIERLYAHTEGPELDGTIFADPFMLATLLEQTGSVRVPDTRTRVDSDTVVPFLTNRAYARFPDPRARKVLLGRTTAAVVRRFLAGTGDGAAFGRVAALAQAASEGHLLVHAAEKHVQGGLEKAGVAGRLADPRGDFVAVIGNSGSGNKVDYYTRRKARYAVTLGPGGSARARLEVVLSNRAPSKGLPRRVIGPYPGTSAAGENVTHLSTYCARSCRLESFERNGAADQVGSERELSHPVYSATMRVPPREEESVAYAWRVARAWEGDDGAGTYRLTFQNQTTIRPTRLEILVVAPQGAHITRTRPVMRVTGNRATWEGEPGAIATFEVRFEQLWVDRALRALGRFLGRPAVRIGG